MGMRQVSSSGKGRNMDRFIYYFAGLAIGCVILGMVQMARMRQASKAGLGVVQPGPAAPAVPAK